MAVTYTIKGEEGKAMYPLRYVAKMFLDQTIESIEANLQTQKVWPAEIYPGFHITNEFRRMHHMWYATGEGERSFEGDVIKVDETSGLVELAIRYNDYMQYVDIGVGAGRKAGDVERGRKVRYKSRYVNNWKPKAGKTHRPAIMPTIRHLATRLGDYTADFYGNKAEFNIYETFEGLTIHV